MATTRAQIEFVLVRRCGKLLAAAELDGTTADGHNPDLSEPIAYAARQCGASVANVALVIDAELAGITTTDKLFDVAEWRTLANILGNLDGVDISEGPHSERLSQLADRVQKRMDTVRAHLATVHGVSAAQAEAGVVDWNFAQEAEA